MWRESEFNVIAGKANGGFSLVHYRRDFTSPQNVSKEELTRCSLVAILTKNTSVIQYKIKFKELILLMLFCFRTVS